MAQVKVTVVDDRPVCDPEQLDVSGNNVNIKWKMDTAGWSITDITGLPADVFEDPGKDGKGYKVKDKGGVGEWNYTVVLAPDGEGASISVDPSIRNLPDL
ncbi:MAG: hypothetical protein OES38_05625 [Gammaproteobacteria bacterium]|nr:hypothetical protein [Gammaproteobacteria bacterium]